MLGLERPARFLRGGLLVDFLRGDLLVDFLRGGVLVDLLGGGVLVDSGDGVVYNLRLRARTGPASGYTCETICCSFALLMIPSS